METTVAYKFVNWDVPALEILQNSRVYQLRMRLDRGESINHGDKNWITQYVNSNIYFKSAIPLQGYCFDFSDVLKRFWVKQDGQITENRTTDKTALREYLYGRIDSIVEIS
ncbi:MAG: molybdenum ABC transporter ATP-binding protein [Bacteroidia bacterium]|nr:molybdenum ABC transporter ATP-binding protein [Bacteroidia bacterium]